MSNFVWLAERAHAIRHAENWTKAERDRSWAEWDKVYAQLKADLDREEAENAAAMEERAASLEDQCERAYEAGRQQGLKESDRWHAPIFWGELRRDVEGE